MRQECRIRRINKRMRIAGMQAGNRAEVVRGVFDRIEAALQQFDACAARYPVDSPAFAAALADFQAAWQRFLADWDAAFADPSALPRPSTRANLSAFRRPASVAGTAAATVTPLFGSLL